LALWDIGVKRWTEKRSGKATPERRPGVTINRRDLIALPVPDANLLWRDLHVRDVRRRNGKPQTQNIRIDVVVEGVSEARPWVCGMEFDYANEESFYCRPMRLAEGASPERMSVPDEASRVRVAFLPPMSGLSANETRLDPGAINVRLGEGRTAEVLRNLCHRIFSGEEGQAAWANLRDRIRALFGVGIEDPKYVAERGEIVMTYESPAGVRLDLSSAGRGLHQTLLLLAHLAANPGSVLLLDEPDAHLEILRQRQTYQLLTEAAREQSSQVIAASHSEVVLNEAADRDVVVAFLGKPHRIDDRGSQLLTSLKEIGYEKFYQAEQAGWVLFLEGSTDLAILRELSKKLDHPVREHLERPFVEYVQNQPARAQHIFYGLREAKKDLVGLALYDRLELREDERAGLTEYSWRKREIENYICHREALLRWAAGAAAEVQGHGPLFAAQWSGAMDEAVKEIQTALETLGRSPWSDDIKASDEFLAPIFVKFYEKLGLPNLMPKTDYHVLARFLTKKEIDPEVVAVLDRILEVASRARPAGRSRKIRFLACARVRGPGLSYETNRQAKPPAPPSWPTAAVYTEYSECPSPPAVCCALLMFI
jgi:hypothetical protein